MLGKRASMKLSNLLTSLLILVGVAFTAQAQWVKLPLPGTPRTKDGKPNLTAPAPRASDGHPDLSGIWLSSRHFSNPKGRGLEHFMPCLLYTSDAADERSSVDLGGR